MPEPTAIVGAVFSGLNGILQFAQQSAHFAEVTNEVRQLQINVRLADDSIKTAHRLIRLKGHYLDNHLLNDVDQSIKHTENILQKLRDSVEGCRKDIETRGSVSVKNRTIWVVFKNHEFLSKLATLTNAMNALNRDINRMETARMPEMNAPPIYTEYADGDEPAEGATVRSFPRSPTMRRKVQREKSQRSLHSIAADGRDNLGLGLAVPQSLRPSPSTFSFTSSVTAIEQHFGQPPADEGLTHVMSAPSAPFELPGSVSLGYGFESPLETLMSDYVVDKWEDEQADKLHPDPMKPPPVPPKPRAPRRRSNFI